MVFKWIHMYTYIHILKTTVLAPTDATSARHLEVLSLRSVFGTRRDDSQDASRHLLSNGPMRRGTITLKLVVADVLAGTLVVPMVQSRCIYIRMFYPFAHLKL